MKEGLMCILYFEGDRNWDALKWLCEEKKERLNQTVSALAMMEAPLSISKFSSLNFLDFSWVSYRTSYCANSFFFVMFGCGGMIRVNNLIIHYHYNLEFNTDYRSMDFLLDFHQKMEIN